MPKLFALVDCNNFYVSCERAFNPKLEGKPVVVLSNNDGCAVARSNEVKALGVPMGAPYFKFKEVLDSAGTVVFSSNYALYGDMSQRVMSILSEYSDDMEIYSIDEAFLCFDGMDKDRIDSMCREIRSAVLRSTGIPVSIGVGGSKTIAKMANELAKSDGKKSNLLGGVLNLYGVDLEPYLRSFEVEDIWGVGRKYAKLLRANNINTAFDFISLDDAWVKSKMTLMGLRTKKELMGYICHELEPVADPKKGIASTRSFGKSVTTLAGLEEAVSSYATRGAEKLRKENLAATYLYVFVMTNRFKTGYYYNSFGFGLPTQSDYTPDLINHAKYCLGKIFKEGLEYKKAGIFLTGLVPKSSVQLDLYSSSEPKEAIEKKEKIMSVMDKINKKYGKYTLKSLSIGTSQPWKMLSNMRSKRYTTVWEEVLRV